MRKPRDIDAELKALAEKAKQLKERRVQQLGELVIATGADSIDAERIRTCDPLLPKQMRYQAALLPDWSSTLGRLVFGTWPICPCSCLVTRTRLHTGGPGRIRTRDLAVMSGQL